MKNLPVIEVKSTQVGPLGLALGEEPDLGGAAAPNLVFVPILKVTWADERETCNHVHNFVFFETPPDLAGCPDYVAGEGHFCRRMGEGTPCAFLEGPDAQVWQKSRRWKRVPFEDRFAFFWDPDDTHPEGEPLPKDEGVAS